MKLPAERLARWCALTVLVSGAVLACSVSPALASFGVTEQNFEANTCKSPVAAECTYSNPSDLFTQAAGHPEFGITSFELNSKEVLLQHEPEGALKRVRVDIPPGLAADPEAPPKCSIASFQKDTCPSNTQVGVNELVVFSLAADVPVSGPVYNLEQPPGIPLYFGIHVEIPAVANEHVYLEGHVNWSGDYHEYFEINNVSKASPVLKSKLIFKGRSGGNFLTLPSECSNTATSHLEVESWTGQISTTPTHTPVGVNGCDKVPFAPTALLTPETAQSDQPDGVSGEVKVPQNAGPLEINTADIKDAHVILPEEMTLNPAAAHGLEACTAAQIGIGTTAPVSCPAASKIGTVVIETDLPPGSLAGNVYLGSPEGGPITGPPFTIYVDAESPLGVSVRLKGLVNPDPNTGRVETTFAENPQLPFSDAIFHFTGGPLAPLVNPLVCGTGQFEAMFTPYTGQPAALSSTPFVTAGCSSSTPPFALGQSTSNAPSTAGAHTSYTFNLGREDGNQFLREVSTTLPPGLIGVIPSVPLCGEPQASQGTCGAASQIGTATVAAGAGSMPYLFSGPVSLTGPYGGAPYGLSIAVPAVAGPFNLGTVVTRAKINVDLYTGRVITTGAVPTIVKGVPVHLKSLSVAVNRANFLLNPTNCGALATESTLTSTFGGIQHVSSPFAASGCGGLAFKPTFSASSGAHTSKTNGASFETKITQGAHQANIRQVIVSLPKQLPSRLTTLQKACPVALFETGIPPGACPSTSQVGTVTVSTPVLPDKLTGPAYLVSHGGGAFPDLDLVLRGDGVEVVLVGHTQITKGITTSKFETLPDVPVTSAVVNLPTGPRSLLAANGSLCGRTLTAPTTIVAQNGATINRRTKIVISHCPVAVAAHRTSGTQAIVTVMAPEAGRISVGGRDLRHATRRVSKEGKVVLRVRLTRAGVAALHRSRRLKRKLRVGFVPRSGPASHVFVTVTFRG